MRYGRHMTDYPISTRFTAEERESLRSLADAEHRTVANLIYVMVLEGIAARQKAKAS